MHGVRGVERLEAEVHREPLGDMEFAVNAGVEVPGPGVRQDILPSLPDVYKVCGTNAEVLNQLVQVWLAAAGSATTSGRSRPVAPIVLPAA